MNNENLKNTLIADAKKLGICADGFKNLLNFNLNSVDFYIQMIDWALERQFPSLDIIRAHFNNVEEKGIYVDKSFKGELFSDKQVYVFHNCSGVITIDWDAKNAIIPMLYFANDCRLTILCGDNNVLPDNHKATIPLYIFGNNIINVEDGKYVNFKKYIKPTIL